MEQASTRRRIGRVVFGATASLALLTGAVACKVMDRPVQIDHAVSDPSPCTALICRPGYFQR